MRVLMTKMERCPVCGNMVNPLNIEKHLRTVHPSKDAQKLLGKRETKRAIAGRRDGTNKREAFVVMATAIAVIVVVILAISYEAPLDTMKGEQAPHFEIVDVSSGRTYRLPEDFCFEVVFLEFFRPGCTHCQEFVPVMNQLHANFRSDVVFMSIDVNSDDTEEDIEAFKQDYGSGEWIYGIDTTGIIAEDYDVRGIPKCFIIDLQGAVEGTIDWDKTGAEQYDEIAAEVERVLES